MILGISGKAGSGKDTVADYLISMGIMDKKHPFAKAVKDICGLMFNISEHDLYNNKDKTTDVIVTDNVISLIPSLKNRKGTCLSVRELLQYFGTDIARKFYKQVWISVLLNNINKNENVVISDVRFKNEADAIKKAGGKLIRLTRNPYNMEHESETELDDYKNFDIIYDNRGQTPEVTCKNIMELLKLK